MIAVDTSALIAILNKEPERDRFLDVLANEDRPVLSAVTFYEIMLIASARRGTPDVPGVSLEWNEDPAAAHQLH